MADSAALTAQLLQLQIQAYEEQLLASPRYAARGNLARFHHQVFSQYGEDGVVAEIFRRIGVTTRTFAECGVGNGLENNTVYLLQQGWRGAWVDGSEKLVAGIRTTFARQIDRGRLAVARALVTTENVEQVFAAVGVKADLDLLSLDIDRNTYWVWEALTSFRPRVVVIEYNAQYPPPVDWVVDYHAERGWNRTSYYGASLSAYERLGREKGYALVGCSLNGVNAFFVREELCGDLFDAPFTAEHHFEPVRYFLIRRNGFPRATADDPLV
jgi:hypothetical protein